MRFKKWVNCCCLLFILCSLGSWTYAGEMGVYPRLSYMVSASDSTSPKTMLGEYWYVGGVLYEDEGGEVHVEGPSLKYGIGETGEKWMLGYYWGNVFVSTELGLAYIQQDMTTQLPINADYKGFAVEAAARFGLVMLNVVVSEKVVELEYGFGF